MSIAKKRIEQPGCAGQSARVGNHPHGIPPPDLSLAIIVGCVDLIVAAARVVPAAAMLELRNSPGTQGL
jgi:hypothetical protein